MLQKVNVFEARTEGYRHYRIPLLVMSTKGTLIVFAEARRGEGDWTHNDIVMKRSYDQGETWEDMKLAISSLSSTLSNLVAIVDRHSDRLHFVYCEDYARVFYMYSDDECDSFSGAVEITTTFEQYRGEYDWIVCATGPGHGLQMKTGRMIVPIWLSLSLDKSRHRPSVTSVVYSDDNGKTWQRGDIIPVTDTIINPNETSAVELADGSVYFSIRNESPENRRAYSISSNGATDWSVPVLDHKLEEPICFGSMIRLSDPEAGDKSRVLFVNPVDLSGENKFKSRRNLTVSLSYDECHTWEVRKLLEAGDAEYSDLAVSSDHTVYCVYSRQFIDGGYDPRYMTVARFNLEWLTDGLDSAD
jgi:sialidase-1